MRRPKYACRACEDGVVQAPAPARLIEGGLPPFALRGVAACRRAELSCSQHQTGGALSMSSIPAAGSGLLKR
jgi:hypothetical protein